MTTSALIEALGYSESQRFVTPEKMDALPDGELAFAFRRLMEPCADGGSRNGGRWHGAYLLQDDPGGPAVPVVYVIDTESDAKAHIVHRAVWNQNLAPFVIVVSPTSVRLYSGFAYEHGADTPLREVAARTSAALEMLAAFTAAAIDDGTIWQKWGDKADPMRRADESLLRDLRELDRILQQEHEMHRKASHGLIGKFVYLYYLRHRNILSNRKLDDWGIPPLDLFSRVATLKALRKVNDELQTWLNGSVFQLGDDALANVTADQLRIVASVFAGDTPGGQLHLDFQAYDFSQIPIETLSCVYEQFLHDSTGDAPSRGKSLGAYYTPIPLADYMIAEMEKKRPLQEGMKVLDPSCGSGAFLVQCYRRLIEKQMRDKGRTLLKTELRSLLTNSIFGIDRDPDACRVAELSLILTLLDYVTPPDLEDTNFKLPTLRDQNIFEDDFFRTDGPWQKRLGNARFDWCIGNPPWSEVKGTPPPEHEHHLVRKWMSDHAADCPTGGNQIAEAFLWKAAEHLDVEGVAGLLVPAMTWFKKESVNFRKQFFNQRGVWCLANFANLAYVLFAGRAESPAAAIFYRPKPPKDDDSVLTFAPFVAEQVANRPERMNRRRTTWNVIVNHADASDVQASVARQGSSLIWKLAMWGSARDARLLARLEEKYSPFELWRTNCGIKAHQGLELRTEAAAKKERLEEHRELIGKLKVSFEALRGIGRTFSFPPSAFSKIQENERFVREGRAELAIAVSTPPHLIVDASRRFAVFSEEFAAIPPRQVGIAGANADLLRALSVFLSSDFCTYHQFMSSPQWGVDMNRADLEALKQLPIPFEKLSTDDLAEWVKLHRELTSLSEQRFSVLGWQHADEDRFATLLDEVNTRVFRLLGLRATERWLVEDFVRINLELNKGKVTEEVMREPTPAEVALYFTTLRNCLDGFLPATQGLRHKIDAITSQNGAFFSVAAVRAREVIAPAITDDAGAEAALRNIREKLRRKHSQWVYFDRSLKRYERGVFYQFKPMQRLHWSRRQAVLDADEIIAETLDQGGEA